MRALSRRFYQATVVLAIVAGWLVLQGAIPAAVSAATYPAGTGLIFYKSGAAPSGYRSILSYGHETNIGPSNFSAGWTHIAISRDTALFYNSANGLGVTGTYINGVFVQKQIYHFSTGWTNIISSCDTVFFFNYHTQLAAYGTLKGGYFAQRGTKPFHNVQEVVASCDSLLVYNYTGGGALAFPMTGGTIIGAGTAYHLNAGWSQLTATDDSILFRRGSLGAWGRLIAGQFTQTGSSNSFSTAFPVGTKDSILFYTGAGSAGVATLKSGAYHYVGTVTGFASWALISGAK